MDPYPLPMCTLETLPGSKMNCNYHESAIFDVLSVSDYVCTLTPSPDGRVLMFFDKGSVDSVVSTSGEMVTVVTSRMLARYCVYSSSSVKV